MTSSEFRIRRGRQPSALRRHALLALLFATLPNYAQAETELTAQDCGEAVQTTVDINLSSGVYVYTEKVAVNTPLKIKIPAGMDEGAYFECLTRNHLIDPREAGSSNVPLDGMG